MKSKKKKSHYTTKNTHLKVCNRKKKETNFLYPKEIGNKHYKNILHTPVEKIWRFDLYDKLNELGSNYLDNKNENYWIEIQNVCESIINNILKNKVRIQMFYEINKEINYDKIKNSFHQCILLPYLMYGNKHIKYFKEYSRFISQFSFPSKLKKDYKDDDIILYRCMDEEEYNNLKNSGINKSLSYTSNPNVPISYKFISTLLDLNKKNIIVGVVFNRKDIIFSVDEGTLSGENEVLVKVDSKPKIIQLLSSTGKDQLVEEFGEEILNFLPLNPNEVCNGFNYIDSLIKKGYKWGGIKNESTNQYEVNSLDSYLNYEKNVCLFVKKIIEQKK